MPSLNHLAFGVVSLIALSPLACARRDVSPTAAVSASTVADTPAPHPEVARPDPSPVAAPRVEPGVGIGPLRLGMTRAQIDALGLNVRQQGSLPDSLEVGPYGVVMTRGVVSSIELRLDEAHAKDGLSVKDTVIPSTARSLADVAAHFDGCGKLEPRIGANVITCRGVVVKEGMNDQADASVVTVQVERTRDPAR